MEGLDWCGVLKEMRKQPVRMEEVFVPQQRTVTVDLLWPLLVVRYSMVSEKRALEEKAMKVLKIFMEDLEGM